MTTINVRQVFGPFLVELDHDGERADCWVSWRNHSASLAALVDTGQLEDRDFCNPIQVDPDTISKMVEWALERGW